MCKNDIFIQNDLSNTLTKVVGFLPGIACIYVCNIDNMSII